MCQCTPEIKSPFCGKPGCKWPMAVERTELGLKPAMTIDEALEFADLWAPLYDRSTVWRAVCMLLAEEVRRLRDDRDQAIKAEREACAKVCEGEYVEAAATGCSEDVAYNNACDHAAAAIRSRSNKTEES
jgi:hypothetical protein